jgi:hypothetical protein
MADSGKAHDRSERAGRTGFRVAARLIQDGVSPFFFSQLVEALDDFIAARTGPWSDNRGLLPPVPISPGLSETTKIFGLPTIWPSATSKHSRTMYKIRVFDELIYDADANLTGILIGSDWQFWRIGKPPTEKNQMALPTAFDVNRKQVIDADQFREIVGGDVEFVGVHEVENRGATVEFHLRFVNIHWLERGVMSDRAIAESQPGRMSFALGSAFAAQDLCG